MDKWEVNASRIAKSQQLPPTALANSLTTGRESQVRSGNELSSGRLPVPSYESVNGIPYVRDLIPDAGAGRLIELQAESPFSSQTTVVVGYRSTDEGENQNNGNAGELSYMSTPLRDYRVLCQFGTGATRHDAECDIAEGGTITLPAAHVNVTIYATQFSRNPSSVSSQNQLKSQAHLASWSGVSQSKCTDQVLCPFQVDVDLLDPPTINQHLANLWGAICDRALLIAPEIINPI